MTPYKGIIRITCTSKIKCRAVPGENVQPGCLGCNQALCQILDLEGKVIFDYNPLPATLKTGKPAKNKTN